MHKLEEALILAAKAFLSAYAMENTSNTALTPKAQKPVAKNWAPPRESNGVPICPVHEKNMKPGKFGFYCTAKEDDPTLSNKNGYCNYKPARN